jgi:hypothetical protein
VAQVAALEDELRTLMHQQDSRIFFQIKGKRVEFEKSVRTAHRELKKECLSLASHQPTTKPDHRAHHLRHGGADASDGLIGDSVPMVVFSDLRHYQSAAL